jgi:hypothetical protein
MKVTKWSTFPGDLTVSEQMAEPTSGESGSIDAVPAVPHASEAPSEPGAASAPRPAPGSISIEAPKLVPEQGEIPEAEAPKAEQSKTDLPKVDFSKADFSKAEADVPKVEADAPKAEAPGSPGKIMIMSGFRAWEGEPAAPEPKSEPNSGMFGKRRLSALAAVVALATVAGALGGALATAGVAHWMGDGATAASSADNAFEATVARIDADILVLKASVEHTSKLGMVQFNKTSDRLDKVEKAQAEPAAKLAKLSEAVDKLRAAPAAAPVPVAAAPAAAKEVTGSIAPPATAPAAAPKAEVGRLPTVEGWVLRDVGHGGALIEGRQGIYEVYAGDPVPGLGKIDAIRKQDGRWVVVTTKGLIVAR